MKTKTLMIVFLVMSVCSVNSQTSDYSMYLMQAEERLREGNCDAALRNYSIYKELSGLTSSSIEAQINECNKSINEDWVAGFVNLGLPSGTLWKDDNEKGYYTYEQAINHFGNKLPTKSQFEELVNYCTWVWKGGGYLITGKNGNTLFLAAAGCIPWTIKDNQVCRVGETGIYASSTPYTQYNSKDLYGLFFGREMIKVSKLGGTNKISVRLIH